MKKTDANNKDINEWIGLIASDAERADVIKTFITENAKTERNKVDQEFSTKKSLYDTEGWHVVRAFHVLLFVIFVIAASITANNYITTKFTPAPATSAK